MFRIKTITRENKLSTLRVPKKKREIKKKRKKEKKKNAEKNFIKHSHVQICSL